MLSARCHQLLRVAAAGPVARIRLDGARAPERLKPVFGYIEEHLFDPALRVKRLKKALGLRHSSFSMEVREACSRTPRGYIEDRRCETACRLLEADELRVWQIAELLGFSALHPRLSALGRREPERLPPAGGEGVRRRADRSPGVELDFADPALWRRGMAGELSPAEATVVIERLRRLYPL